MNPLVCVVILSALLLGMGSFVAAAKGLLPGPPGRLYCCSAADFFYMEFLTEFCPVLILFATPSGELRLPGLRPTLLLVPPAALAIMCMVKLGARDVKLIESYLLILRTVCRVFFGDGSETSCKAYASMSSPSFRAISSKSASFSAAS